MPAGSIIPGNTQTDVVVRVARRVVQIQRQDPGVAAIIPIATANEPAFTNNQTTISSILL